jgi:hypothetical protein
MQLNAKEKAKLQNGICALKDLLESHHLAKYGGEVRTRKYLRLSRSKIAKPPVESRGILEDTSGSWFFGGIRTGSIAPRNASEVISAPIWFGPDGQPFATANGESTILHPGYATRHQVRATGDHAESVKDIIERLNAWVSKEQNFVKQLLFSQVRTDIRSGAWPDVLHEIALNDDAGFEPVAWYIDVGLVDLVTDKEGNKYLVPSNRRMPSFGLEAWASRHEHDFMKQCITEADEVFIGDPPEQCHCEQPLLGFLRDSERALNWLRSRVEESGLTQPAIATEVANVKKQSKGGRPQKTKQTRTEKLVLEVWAEGKGKHRTYAQCDIALKLVEGTTKGIVDAFRQLKKREEQRMKQAQQRTE